MEPYLSRRGVIIGGAALVLDGCSGRGQAKADTIGWDTRPAAPWQPAPPTAIAAGGWYTVARGDTMSGIARRTGVSVAELLTINKVVPTDLAPGRVLWVPGVAQSRLDQLAQQAATVQPDQPAPDDDFAPGDDRGGYVLVPRSAWTSQRIAGNNQAMGGVQRITVHHTGEYDGFIGLSDAEVLRRIERYHRESKRWAAIGYHFVVGKDGKVYEGRPARYQGAHVRSANENNLGISVIGDFMRQPPPQRQLAALNAFLNDARTRYQLSKPRVYGHRDLGGSLCPGDALYAWMKRYKTA